MELLYTLQVIANNTKNHYVSSCLSRIKDIRLGEGGAEVMGCWWGGGGGAKGGGGVLSYSPGIGEPSLDKQSGVPSPPMCVGDAGALLEKITQSLLTEAERIFLTLSSPRPVVPG